MESTVRPNPALYDDSRSVLLFADRPSRRLEMRTVIESLGGRVVEVAPIAGSLARLDARISLDAVIVDADETSADFEALAARLDHAAAAGSYRSVIVIPPDLIDHAAAFAPHPGVALLCAPSEFERTAAVAEAIAEPRIRLHDVNSDNATPRLRQLSEEIGRIARVLATMSGEEHAGVVVPPRPDPVPASRRGETIVDAIQVRAMIRARRLRELFFASDLFADPAWDMLLDLMAARLERRQVAVSSLCIAAAVPPTTALRWIKLLTEQGILIRIADPTDGRRVFIELSDAAAEGMMSYLAAAQRLATITP
ncbi:winged helix DNA-binding protein [Sphingomonas solaris]|uniref:MarR family transcriptional regulator n=1 Tax=Alterirhizorhabdus solaris TaxID=2529389 RepID=A0A558R9R2_9SPHN|nr:winged helix DNA-binding protein [Sphingomonas solaris]TVV76116.1 MarR family transcriptional regulator [Sphingomonas solaris]